MIDVTVAKERFAKLIAFWHGRCQFARRSVVVGWCMAGPLCRAALAGIHRRRARCTEGETMTLEINSCTMPTPAKPDEQEIYRRFRDTLIKAHCEAKRAHNCCGKITIDRNHITFNCPLCGDARQVIR